MSNASIKSEKTYTITAGGVEFPGWRRVEGWNGFARLERQAAKGVEFAITVDPLNALSMLSLFDSEDKTSVLQSDCRPLIEALEKKP